MKKYVILFMNDLRPVALTSAVIKTYQRIVLNKMSVLLKDVTDLYSLPIRKTYVSMMHFYMWQYYSTYFSSAFYTIQPHIFARKLLDTNVS